MYVILYVHISRKSAWLYVKVTYYLRIKYIIRDSLSKIEKGILVVY